MCSDSLAIKLPVEVPMASSNHLKSCQKEKSYSRIEASNVRVDDSLKPSKPQKKVQSL